MHLNSTRFLSALLWLREGAQIKNIATSVGYAGTKDLDRQFDRGLAVSPVMVRGSLFSCPEMTRHVQSGTQTEWGERPRNSGQALRAGVVPCVADAELPLLRDQSEVGPEGIGNLARSRTRVRREETPDGSGEVGPPVRLRDCSQM